MIYFISLFIIILTFIILYIGYEYSKALDKNIENKRKEIKEKGYSDISDFIDLNNFSHF